MIYSVFSKSNETVTLKNRQNLFTSFYKLTSTEIKMGVCHQISCGVDNVPLLDSSASDGWTAFCPAFFVYGTTPSKNTFTTIKPTIKPTVKSTVKPIG